MQKRKPGKSNLEVSAIGFGCMGPNFSYGHDGHIGIAPMSVKQVDDPDAQLIQRGVADLLDMLGAAVQANSPS
jgi:aryl-alcohol dehydrogenase-like predicted oxidoreductase